MKVVKSTPKRRKSTAVVKHRRKAKKTGLSAMFTPTTAKNSVKATVAAFGGGLAARKTSQLVNTMTGGKNSLLFQLGAAFLGGLIMHSTLNAPNLASGFVGGMAAVNSADMGLGEDNVAFADDGVLSELPEALDEYGNPVSLEEFEEWEEV